MKHVLLQQAFVLHRRPYRETSFLLDVFTPDYGRVSLIAKGVRQKRSTALALLQPFIPLLLSWRGKSELMTLLQVEMKGIAVPLQGDCLFAGFYLNELLMYLLEKWDPNPDLYEAYQKTIEALQQPLIDERRLRSFEKYLLGSLGYGLLPQNAHAAQALFLTDCYYRFLPEQGFVLSEDPVSVNETLFSGKSLLAFVKEDWQDEESLKDAKRLIRCVLTPLLGSRSLHSRRLFVKSQFKE